MKKTIKTFATVLSVMVAASCAVNNEIETPSASFDGMLKAVIEDVSKTYVDDLDTPGAHKVKWSDTDAICVNGSSVSVFGMSEDKTEAYFPAEGLEAPYRAVYPAGVYVEGSFVREVATVIAPGDTTHTGYKAKDGKYYDWMQVTVPGTQNYVAGTYDPQAAVMAASREAGTLRFVQMSAYLKLTVAGASNIRRVVLKNGNTSRGMSGVFDFVFKGDNLISSAVNSVTEPITMDCGEDGVPAGTPILIVIPCRDYTSGITIMLEDMEGRLSSFKSSPVNLLDYPGAVVPVNVTFNAVGGEILTADDWNQFVAYANNNLPIDAWLDNGVVKIGADIEAEDLARMKVDWTYVLDGQGHSITQSAANGPLFTTVNGGEVKNLTLYGQIGDNVEDASTPGYVSLVQIVKGGGLISNVSNHMNMLAGVQEQSHIAMAGICRQILGGTIEDCINAGEIRAAYPAKTTVNCYAAGIVAIIGTLSPSAPALEGPVLIKNCQNYAKVRTENTTTSAAYPMHYNALGGIVSWIAYDKGEYSATLYNCSNTAEVSTDRGMDGPNVSFATVGGIVGCAYFPNNAFTYTNNKKDYGVPTGRSFACPYGCKLWPTSSGSESHKDGVFFRLEKCYNSGVLYNAAPSNSAVASSTLRMKQYTGGIAGVAIGELERHAQIVDCTSVGIVDGGSDYSRSSYQSVNAGLVGLAGALDVSGCEVGTETYALVIGRTFTTFASGGLFGLMPVACNVSDCTLNLEITAAGAGHDSMPYYAALAAMVKGGSSSQGGYLKDETDPTVYYAGSSFKNVKVKGSIAHGKTLSSLTTATFDAETTAGLLFCKYDASNSDVQAFDMTGTGFWE